MAGGALVLLTLVAYSRALPAGFVWDDDDYVTHNPTLRSTEGLARIWTEPGAVPQYYPLVHTTYWLEYRLWGLEPAGYHAVNVALHAAVALLWWLVLRRLGLPGAWLAAAVFAVHPVHVESVAWVTERKNVLSGLFYLLAFLAYLRYRPPGAAGAQRPAGSRAPGSDRRFYALALACFVAALLAKTVTATLPAAILLVLWWKRSLAWRDVVRLLPFFAVGLALSGLTVWMERSVVGAEGETWDLSFAERLLLAGRALWFYAGKLLWPHPLAFFYRRWTLDAAQLWQWLFPLAAVAVVAALAALRGRLGRGPLTAVLFFGGTLFPALGFLNVFPFRYSWVADHFQYLASMGLIALAVGALVHRLAPAPAAIPKTARPDARPTARRAAPPVPPAAAPPALRQPATVAAAAALALLGTLTWRQCRIYDGLESLWLDTVAKTPDAWAAHNNLGKHYEDLAAADPAAAAAYRQKAFEAYEKAAEAAARTGAIAGETYNNYANLLEASGRRDEALAYYQRAIEVQPQEARFHRNLGLLLDKLDRPAEAEATLREAFRLRPAWPQLRADLGIVLSRLGRLDEAEQEFEAALRDGPADASIYYNAAQLYLRTSRPEQALDLLDRAVTLDPSYARAQQALGILLVQAGRAADGLVHLERAVELEPADSQARFNLAMALMAAGRGDAARRELEATLRLAEEQGRTELAALVRSRLAPLR